MKNLSNIYKSLLFIVFVSLTIGCSTQQDTSFNRSLQNLSAKYNFIYNSNLLLKDYELLLSKNFSGSFEEILPVYTLPDAALSSDKNLIQIISKAQAIISEKNISNYLDEAYMLLGKANYYQDFQFSAVEYFNYVQKAFVHVKGRQLNALNWKARSEIQLNKIKDAEETIATINSLLSTLKKGKTESYATITQWHINRGNYPLAIFNLKLALKGKKTKLEADRWEYILAQLYDKVNNPQESLKYYKKVARSNAPFDLYFNANLNKVKLQSLLSTDSINKEEQILALLKDDKNEDYIDQIYYKTAELYAEDGDFINAEKYYKLSIAKSTQNTHQKGLAYLKLADLNFSNKKDYLTSKLYYDSALTTLPKTYIAYKAIEKKSNSLEYLSSRFENIAFQDTLQLLANLTDAERLHRINLILGPEAPLPTVNNNNTPQNNANQFNTTSSQNNTNFYFNNPTAISIGFTDFKRKWGSRPLEDNWRQSSKPSQLSAQNTGNNASGESVNQKPLEMDNSSRELKIQRYLDNIPSTPDKKLASNNIIKSALFEIASFYQQELNEPLEAIKYYEELLRRFPDYKRDVIYYSLFRAYQTIDEDKVEKYKDLIIKEYPNTAYANAVLDPLATFKESEKELKVQELYNIVYQEFEDKTYSTVISKVDSILTEYPNNKISAQYDYLKSIAIGRTNSVDTLLTVFNNIVANHPQDSIITPLVKEHIEFINNNINEFRNRTFALNDFDINDPRFLAQNTVAPIRTVPTPIEKPIVTPIVVPPVEAIDPPITETAQNKIDTIKINPVKVESATGNQPPPSKPTITQPQIAPPVVGRPVDTEDAIVNDGTFTNSPSDLYYFVIYIDDPSITLSSSRFGIGQFNRSNYPTENLRHQLQELEADQLIFVGNFTDLESIKKYNTRISGQMGSIMKIPANRYQYFMISKENFEKLNSRARILQYITFFSKNIK